MSSLLLLGSGWLCAAVVMALLWMEQRRTNNAGIVDVAWAAAIGGLALAYGWFSPGDPWHRAGAASMGGIWGLRLALHIHRRGRGKPEDGRYQQLRREWGAHVQSSMFGFFQLQAAAVAFFSVPFLLAARHSSGSHSAVEIAGFLLWLTGILGEATADRQLEAFKSRASSKGTVCRDGLWRYSRHPNYFFEWVTWCGIALFASTAPAGWLAWCCPAAMLVLLFRFTGIPATEAQALRTKGDAYLAYQRSTPAFFPWFPRSTSC